MLCNSFKKVLNVVPQEGMISYRKTSGALKNNYVSARVVNRRNKLNEMINYSDSVELFKIALTKCEYRIKK